MHLNTIQFRPNAKYVAEGKRSMGGGSSIGNLGIRLETDNLGRVIRFEDGFMNSLDMADTWDYLKLQDAATGDTIDLRLHTAASTGNLGLAKEALAENADVALRMKQGATPLHWASAHGRFDIAKILVEHQADVNSVDELGWMPIFLAAQNGHQAIVSLLQAHGAKLKAMIQGQKLSITVDSDSNSDLLEAAESGDVELAKAALEDGADVNCTTDEGWTALLCAAKADPSLTELLLSNGADPNLASNRGYTPLMRAAGNGRAATARLLLAAGADTEMRDCDGKTAALLAREMGQHECARMVS